MIPSLTGIDHLHLYVTDRAAAADWYQRVLGFTVIEKLRRWSAGEGGPLMIEDPSGQVHLALFQREERAPGSAIAFGCGARALLDWKSHLEEQGLELRLADHGVSWSIYFSDPYGNILEITTYEYAAVEESLAAAA